MTNGRHVLSIFPGIDLLGRWFEEQGFCVVRGPDVLWGGDVRAFNPPAGVYDGIIGGPPCQAFSSLRHLVIHNGWTPKFGNLIPEFERVVFEAAPQWFVMENVPQAPRPCVEGYGVHTFTINNRQCFDADGEPAEQHRVRAISFGWRGGRRVLKLDTVCLGNLKHSWAALGGPQGPSMRNKVGSRVSYRPGPSTKHFNEAKRLQGLPEDFDLPPFTVRAKCNAVGNGVPRALGRAIARGVLECIGRVNSPTN